MESGEPKRSGLRDPRVALAALVALASLAALYGPSLAAHVLRTRHPLVFHDDARQQIFPFHRYASPELLADDLLSDYYLSMFPLAYKGLYAAAAKLWEPLALSQLLPYLLLAATLAALAAAAWRLGGVATAWATSALALGSTGVMQGVGGGLPHSFGFPLAALGLALLAFGRARALLAATCLAAGFYPVLSVILGLTSAGLLLVVRAEDRGTARTWSLGRRLGALAGTALLCGLLLLPAALGSLRWGALIGPGDFERYPEADVGGRYGAALARPWPPFTQTLPRAVERALWSRGQPWHPTARAFVGDGAARGPLGGRPRALTLGLLGLIAVGWLALALRDAAARRLLAMPLATFAGYALSTALDPAFYLPPRYASYALPALALVLIPAAAAACARALVPRRAGTLAATAAVVALTALLLLGVGGRVQSMAGASQDERRHAAILAAVAETPPDALVAGWPYGPIESVPLVAKRAAWLTYETHQAFHVDYVETLRARFGALRDAYLGRTLEPLRALRDVHGVTHLIVDPRHLRDRTPRYFHPFARPTFRHWRRNRGAFALEGLLRDPGAREVGDLVLLDLRALPLPAAAATGEGGLELAGRGEGLVQDLAERRLDGVRGVEAGRRAGEGAAGVEFEVEVLEIVEAEIEVVHGGLPLGTRPD